MADFILNLLKHILSSLYVLFGSVPALESLQQAFGRLNGSSDSNALIWWLFAAFMGGLALFLIFLWLMRYRPIRGHEQLPAAKGAAPYAPSPGRGPVVKERADGRRKTLEQR
ncbi:MAG: hypothetical protein P8018_06620 [Acidobacteriota bacterium]